MKTAEITERTSPMPRDGEIIRLPLGLLGFESCKEYVWVESPEEAPFRWLRAVHDPGLTFLVAPPFDIFAEYAPDISDEDAAFLKLSSPTDALLFCVVTLRPHGQATMNLRGPIVINRSTLRAKQVVLANAGEYPLQYALPTAG